MHKKLPLYIIVETSFRMQNSIQFVNKSLETLIQKLRCDPFLLEQLHLSIITYDKQPKVLIPLTDLSELKLNSIITTKKTTVQYDVFIDFLIERIHLEVRPNSAEVRGDFRPYLIVFNDKFFVMELQEIQQKNIADVIFFVNSNSTDEMCDNVFYINDDIIQTIHQRGWFKSLKIDPPFSSSDFINSLDLPPPPEEGIIIF